MGADLRFFEALLLAFVREVFATVGATAPMRSNESKTMIIFFITDIIEGDCKRVMERRDISAETVNPNYKMYLNYQV